MKTTKLILLTAFLVFAAYGFSYTTEKPTKATTEQSTDRNIEYISINQAKYIPSLSSAIRSQVSPKILELYTQSLYTFHILDHGNHYMVYGYFNDWKKFFTP